MIRFHNVNKSFDKKRILEDINWSVRPGHIVGLVGPNGSGKSTLLRLISGVIEPDCGVIQINDVDVFDNADIKKDVFFLGDDPYFFSQSTIEDMRQFYKLFYPNFSDETYFRLVHEFKLNPSERINAFSKGMKRQVVLILALASRPKILLLDEAFDGLDPIMRFRLRQIITEEVLDNNIIAIISSHNLRELEDICDTIAMINNHTLALNHSSEEVHELYHKYQVVFNEEVDPHVFDSLSPLNVTGKSRIFSIIVKGHRETCEEGIRALNPSLFEHNSVSLEEIFIYEVGGKKHE